MEKGSLEDIGFFNNEDGVAKVGDNSPDIVDCQAKDSQTS